jgi:hypothetical protein
MERTMNTQDTFTFFSILRRASVTAIIGVGLASGLVSGAKAREVYQTPTGRFVKSPTCLLEGMGTVVRSTCAVGRAFESNNTLVVMNGLHMVIKKSDEPGAGSAYIVEDDATLTPISTVVAVGDCWVGHKFRFCAK